MSLLFALFLIICTSSILREESNAFKRVDKRIRLELSSREKDFLKWTESVVDEELEYEIQSHPDKLISDRIINEINVCPTNIRVLAASMAQYGKIPYKIAKYGVQSGSIYNKELIDEWEAQHKFMIWYDNELKLHGILEPLLFVRDKDVSDARWNPKYAVPAIKAQKGRGKYFWYVMRTGI